MSDSEEFSDLFDEPKDFYKPEPEATFEHYTRQSQYVTPGEPSQIKLRLVGKSPLWGHLLWNAGIVTTDFIDTYRDQYITGQSVLELGAAAALPSLNACLSARNVVITDYPDPDLIENININVNLLKQSVKTPKNDKVSQIHVEGYIWGNRTDDILKLNNNDKFDFIILSDLVFNHSEHAKLLKACAETLADYGKILVVFTHHRPKLAHRDLQFFTDAEENYNFKCTKIIQKLMTPMFEKDEGDETVRSMVYGYLIEWKNIDRKRLNN